MVSWHDDTNGDNNTIGEMITCNDEKGKEGKRTQGNKKKRVAKEETRDVEKMKKTGMRTKAQRENKKKGKGQRSTAKEGKSK